MKNPWLRKNLDFVLAILIAIGSSLTAALSYANLLKNDESAHLLFKTIEKGNYAYWVVQNDTCVGTFSTDLKHDGNFLLTANGEIRLTIGRIPTTSRVLVSASFNPLGQLNESTARFASLNSTVAFRSKNINPFSLHIEASIEGQKYTHTLSFPGPILIKKVKGNSYRIEYASISNVKNFFVGPFSSSLSDRLNLKIVDISKEPNRCSKDSSDRLNLNPLIQNLDTMTSDLKFLFPKNKGHEIP